MVTSSGTGPGPGSAAATRARLVEGAVAALRELDTADLLGAVGTRALAARAGVSPATLFHHFGSVQGLAEAVLARVYDPRRPPPEVEIGTGVQEIAGSGLPLDTSLGFHAGELARLGGDPEHRVRVGLWALGGRGGHEGYGTYLRERDAPLHAAALALYDGWGRELRPPLDVATFVAVHAALLSGAAIRTSADPGSITPADFARSASALSLVLLRRKGEARDVDDRLAEINYYPLPDRGTRHHEAGRERAARRTRRDRVLDAATALFADRGYAATSVGDVARVAGSSPSTVHALFDGKAALGVACLSRSLPAAGPAAAWRGDLETVVDHLARHLDLGAVYAADLVAGDRARDDDPVLARVEAALTAGRAGGELTGDSPVADLAETVLVVLLTRLLARPAEGPVGALRWVETVVLAAEQPSTRTGQPLPG